MAAIRYTADAPDTVLKILWAAHQPAAARVQWTAVQPEGNALAKRPLASAVHPC